MGITRLARRFPSPALILACLALFAALGGSTYAATQTSASGKIHFTNAALKHGWTNAPGSSPAGYAKDSLGVVHLRGGVTSGTPSVPMFVLPKGLRPSHTFAVLVNTQLNDVGALTISKNGDVAVAGSSASGFTGLDGVSFVAGE